MKEDGWNYRSFAEDRWKLSVFLLELELIAPGDDEEVETLRHFPGDRNLLGRFRQAGMVQLGSALGAPFYVSGSDGRGHVCRQVSLIPPKLDSRWSFCVSGEILRTSLS